MWPAAKPARPVTLAHTGWTAEVSTRLRGNPADPRNPQKGKGLRAQPSCTCLAMTPAAWPGCPAGLARCVAPLQGPASRPEQPLGGPTGKHMRTLSHFCHQQQNDPADCNSGDLGPAVQKAGQPICRPVIPGKGSPSAQRLGPWLLLQGPPRSSARSCRCWPSRCAIAGRPGG